MLSDYDLQPSLASFDVPRARQWFSDKLGIEPTDDDGVQLDYQFGKSGFGVYEAATAGTAKNTVASWNVPDVAAEVERLRARGVVFEDYDFGDFKTVDGIMTDPEGNKTAWFKDADGNIHTLVTIPQMPETKVTAMIATADLDRAKKWYAEKLAFTDPVFELPGEVVAYRSGAGSFSVYRTSFAGTAQNTVAEWPVDDLRAEVKALRDRGVEFEDLEFDTPEGTPLKTEDGIATGPESGSMQAWFRDPDGNWLSIREEHETP
jgi:catechol 2,3-dioxygenase-like lactoylglutathione lyase family enzyme